MRSCIVSFHAMYAFVERLYDDLNRSIIRVLPLTSSPLIDPFLRPSPYILARTPPTPQLRSRCTTWTETDSSPTASCIWC